MNTDLMYAVFHAAEDKIIGRIRVQKIFYLLEKLGLNGGTRFSYHHYGPYSESLAKNLDFAQLLDGRLKETIEETPYGATYSVFTLEQGWNFPESSVGNIPFDAAKKYIAKMKSRTSVAIELAATIYWLSYEEKVPDWNKELQIRKAKKASTENVKEAIALLTELGLSVPSKH
ncbi:hypothetical protein [Shinella kummerowiae]|uniref:hypothetical protein n=1 Tax=Shinella kummerowiae TaxID=417745 RepID=UPI0021B550D5|nr:hypothetical protein [Shinella kummerowiae]MCT7666561.1 hypothetical protein [Shinella kummerowiae]